MSQTDGYTKLTCPKERGKKRGEEEEEEVAACAGETHRHAGVKGTGGLRTKVREKKAG